MKEQTEATKRVKISNYTDYKNINLKENNTYQLVLSPMDNYTYYLVLGKPKKGEINVDFFKVPKNHNTDSKLRKGFYTQVKECATIDRKSQDWICQSKALKIYGKKIVEKTPYIEVDNPHYKCSANMKLYQLRVLDIFNI